MKKLLIVFLCLITLNLSAQDKITKDVGEFTEVKAYDGISVKLVKDNTNKAIVSGEDADKVVIVNKGGKLKLRMEINKVFSGFRTFVELHYNGRIEILDANENASFSSDETVKQETLDLKAQEGGTIKLDLDLIRLNVKSVTGGIIETTGKAKNQIVNINTGGQYEGDKLKTEQTEVDVNAGGTAYVNASELVEAKVRAGGTIRIYGKPKVIDKQKFMGGKIVEQ